MRVLITGGAGYIGSHATRFFLEHGHNVTVLDNLSHGHTASVPGERFIRGDLVDSALLDAVLHERAIEAVIHFAAFPYVGESVEDPAKYYHNNLANTLNLLAAMRRSGVTKIVFSSTCATYGIPHTVPITEQEPQEPINPYGRTKLAIEWVLQDYAAAYGLSYAALRYFNAAGASPAGDIGEDHDPETHLIPLVLQVALGQRPHIQVFGTDYATPDGTCIRDYVHVDDLAEAHLLALTKLQPRRGLICNLGTGRGHSVLEVIRTCEEITGKRLAVQHGPRRPGDPPRLVAAAEHARAELGWRPRYTELHAIIETAWRWHRSHPNGFGDRK
jgi:UDP-glucose 4-epimerase